MNPIIHNKFFEFNFVLFPVWIVFAYFLVNNLIDSKELTFLLFLILLGESHFAATFLFHFQKENHEYLITNRNVLIFIPLAIIAIYILIGVFSFKTAIFLGAVASGFHVTRQSIGIQRLYQKERTRFYEYVTYFCSFLFLIIGFIRFYSFDFFKNFDTNFGQISIDHFSLACLVIFFCVVAFSEKTNLRKRIVNLTGVLIYSPYLFVDHIYDAVIIGVGAHWCQYLAINYKVYFYNQVINKQKILLILFIIIYSIIMSLLGYQYRFDNEINLLLLIPLSGQVFHYYTDAFIWKFSDPQIRSLIGKKLFA